MESVMTDAGAIGRNVKFNASSARWLSCRWRLGIAIGLCLIGAAVFWVDIRVAEWFRNHRLPGDVARFVDFSEVFAHGLGAAAVLGVTVSLDPFLRQGARLAAARRDGIRLCLAAYAGGLVVDVLKAVVVRVRPRACDFAAVQSAFDTFGLEAAVTVPEAMPAGMLHKSVELMSFPSGHAAVAAGLATALAWNYPHGRWIFITLAACAGFQRVASSAHYPSDVAFGAAIGVAAAAVCLGSAEPAGPRYKSLMVPAALA